MSSQSTQKAHMCNKCTKNFNRKNDLERHMQIHRPKDDRRWKCAYCPKTFAQKGQRNTHHNMHTGSKPFVCPICDKAFGDWSACNRHQLKVHGVVPQSMKRRLAKKHYRTGSSTAGSISSQSTPSLGYLSPDTHLDGTSTDPSTPEQDQQFQDTLDASFPCVARQQDVYFQGPSFHQQREDIFRGPYSAQQEEDNFQIPLPNNPLFYQIGFPAQAQVEQEQQLQQQLQQHYTRQFQLGRHQMWLDRQQQLTIEVPSMTLDMESCIQNFNFSTDILSEHHNFEDNFVDPATTELDFSEAGW